MTGAGFLTGPPRTKAEQTAHLAHLLGHAHSVLAAQTAKLDRIDRARSRQVEKVAAAREAVEVAEAEMRAWTAED